MKRLILFLFSAVLLAGCTKETTVELVDFSDTGCSRQTKAMDALSGGSSDSQLILRYSPEGLKIIRTNATMNCSISQGGITCQLSCEGDVITLNAFETAGAIMKCLCPVDNMTSTVSGLRPGREYVLHYSCSDVTCSPISFTYSTGLDLVIDIDLYRETY